ncbi:MAG: hypothetical protein MHM6MM_001455 [Cercozoa sp. M6MM]
MTVSASHLLVDGLGCAAIARAVLHFLFNDVDEIKQFVSATLPESVEQKAQIDVPPSTLFTVDNENGKDAARTLLEKSRELQTVLRPHVGKLSPSREAIALETRVVNVAALLRACKRREMSIDTVLTTIAMRVCYEVLKSTVSVTPVSLRKEFPETENAIGNYFVVLMPANPFSAADTSDEDFWAMALRVHERKMKQQEGGKVEAYRRTCASMYMPFNVMLLPALRALCESGTTAALEKCLLSVSTVLAGGVASTCLSNYGRVQLPHTALTAATASPFGRSLRFDFCTTNDAQKMTVTVTVCHDAENTENDAVAGVTFDNRQLAATLSDEFCRTLAEISA